MSVDTDWDIESYRAAYESIEHWSLKQEFMEAHKDRIPEDRLVCLAQVFVNIELLGCRYPDKTMEQVSILARDVGKDYKESKKNKLQRTFVKASDAAGARYKEQGPGRKSNEHQNKPLSQRPLSFVKASGSEETTSQSEQVKFGVNEAEKRKIEQYTNLSIEKRLSAFRASGSEQANWRSPQIQFDGNERQSPEKRPSSFKASGSEQTNWRSPQIQFDGNERQSTVNKYKKAVTQNSRQNETASISNQGVNQYGRGIGLSKGRSSRGRGNSGSNADVLQQRKKRFDIKDNDDFWSCNDPLSEFVIVQRDYHTSPNALSLLNNSSAFSRLPLTYNWSPDEMQCTVVINGVEVTTAKGENMRAAKEAAAAEALEFLSHHCYTLQVMKIHASEEEVSLGEISSGRKARGQGANLDKPIEDSSMGSKLLKMMGWTGGGLGKEGSGITEPIKPHEVFGRQGLGHTQEAGVTPRFRSRILGIIRDFCQGSGIEDLAFSPDFSKEQRAEIHKVARRFKLKSVSHGHDEARYLVLSRKFSAKQLIRTLIEEGPTDKYNLIPPC